MLKSALLREHTRVNLALKNGEQTGQLFIVVGSQAKMLLSLFFFFFFGFFRDRVSLCSLVCLRIGF